MLEDVVVGPTLHSEPTIDIGLNSDECRSGGAIGADSMWGEAASEHGHRVVHFSFAGHKVTAQQGAIVRLSETELQRGDAPCIAANALLRRHYPPASRFVRNLLRRNWFQVEGAGSLYAVSRFAGDQVSGGTAWAVAMFLLKYDLQSCPAYVFDQDVCRWFVWNEHWQPIDRAPRPSGIYAGVGTRDLNLVGRLAIKTLFDADGR